MKGALRFIMNSFQVFGFSFGSVCTSYAFFFCIQLHSTLGFRSLQTFVLYPDDHVVTDFGMGVSMLPNRPFRLSLLLGVPYTRPRLKIEG